MEGERGSEREEEGEQVTANRLGVAWTTQLRIGDGQQKSNGRPAIM